MSTAYRTPAGGTPRHRFVAILSLFLTLLATGPTGAVTNPVLNYLPALTPSTIACNPSTAANATQSSCNPLQVANMLSAVFSARVVSTTNITLSGVQTIDGVVVAAGQSVLASGQTSQPTNGLWIVQSGAWTRALNFPAGYVIAQNCDIAVFVREGSTRQGHTFRLGTTAGSITIDTTVEAWTDSLLTKATTAVAGTVFATENVTGTSLPAVILESPGTTRAFDCVAFITTAGSVSDIGNFNGTPGTCIVGDANGHPVLDASGVAPAVTGTGCSLAAGTNSDNTGAIVAAGIDTCTLAFGGAFTTAPHCAIANHGATVLATLTALPTTAHAIFATAAAGTFEYLCL